MSLRHQTFNTFEFDLENRTTPDDLPVNGDSVVSFVDDIDVGRVSLTDVQCRPRKALVHREHALRHAQPREVGLSQLQTHEVEKHPSNSRQKDTNGANGDDGIENEPKMDERNISEVLELTTKV